MPGILYMAPEGSELTARFADLRHAEEISLLPKGSVARFDPKEARRVFPYLQVYLRGAYLRRAAP